MGIKYLKLEWLFLLPCPLQIAIKFDDMYICV